MNLRNLIHFLCFFLFAVSAFAQEARKIDEFGELNCEDLSYRSNAYAKELESNPDSKLFIIFYEGKYSSNRFNKHTRKWENVLVNPRYGEAKNETKAIILNLTKWHKIPKTRVLLFDGGYDTRYRGEVWLLIQNPPLPKPSTTLKKGEIKFRKGKLPKVIDCESVLRNI